MKVKSLVALPLFATVLCASSLVMAKPDAAPAPKVVICHKDKVTIEVSENSFQLPGHLLHGDTLGPCAADGGNGGGKPAPEPQPNPQ